MEQQKKSIAEIKHEVKLGISGVSRKRIIHGISRISIIAYQRKRIADPEIAEITQLLGTLYDAVYFENRDKVDYPECGILAVEALLELVFDEIEERGKSIVKEN